MASIYQWHVFDASPDNIFPTAAASASAALFQIHLNFRHFLELSYPERTLVPLYATKRSYFSPLHLVLPSDCRQRFIGTLLSGAGVSTDFIETVTPEVSSFALEIITNNSHHPPRPPNHDHDGDDNSRRVLAMVLEISVVTPYDDREVIDRALSGLGTMQESTKFKPASKSWIEGMERVKILEDGLKELAEEDCAICLEEFLVGHEIMRLPCGHAFHCICSIRWLETSRLCPLCRFSVP